MGNWITYEPQERHWLTTEGEIVLHGAGMDDPVHDPCNDQILDTLEEFRRLAEDVYLREIIEYVLRNLEDEL